MGNRNTSPDSFSSYRERLLSERKTAIGELQRGSNKLVLPKTLAIEDQASDRHDQFVAVHQQTVAFEKLRQIDAALAGVKSGAFGFCQGCHEPISHKRLSAIPWASYCVPCQEAIAVRAAASDKPQLAART
jgi:DnaK suppressor protein